MEGFKEYGPYTVDAECLNDHCCFNAIGELTFNTSISKKDTPDLFIQLPKYVLIDLTFPSALYLLVSTPFKDICATTALDGIELLVLKSKFTVLDVLIVVFNDKLVLSFFCVISSLIVWCSYHYSEIFFCVKNFISSYLYIIKTSLCNGEFSLL